jgi:two-component system NtrC family sensor kinase
MNNAPTYGVKMIRISFILFCLVFISFFGSAQGFTDRGYWSDLMRYNHLPIDSLWLFHPGKEAPAIDSNIGWEIANTELLQNKNGKPLPMQGAGWYQKTFSVPPDFRNKPVALHMAHFGTSEIFLDGKLIQRYGTVGNSMENEVIYVPRQPVIITFDDQAYHKLLVHYSNFHANNPGYANKHIGFRLYISPSWVESQSLFEGAASLPVSIGIILVFCIYFFFVWLFYPKRLASLLTMILLLDFCIVLISVYFSFKENDWEPLVVASNTGTITSIWLNFFLLLILYALFYRGKMPQRTWLVIASMIICMFAVLYPRFSFLLGVLSILVFFEVIRMFVLGIRNKVTGFWILLIGFLIQQAGLYFIVLDVFNWFPVYTPQLLLVQMIFPQLGIPLTYSLHLAWEFRSANRNLRLQLTQLNELSQKGLEQEQEKQQLLASQNEMLEKQVGERTAALTKSISELKSTQSQLIQSEKMASLGELTAGIAHEIQNPLNFVNNFSEINKEMLEELKAERLKPNAERDEQTEDEIINNVVHNEEKINYHGKRADSIVKGMLEHSRTSTGKKELTDINKLADEYLRLAYHGLRAKDKSFNADFKTDFEDNLGKINAVPQDIGRALLNLFNNAFYVVNEKKKTADESYRPTVTVQTKKISDKIDIKVSDNGSGIPQNLVDKIFQPFFTTKPTGQGTGLGLSLAYDIIKKHGGEIKVETVKGDGTAFIIRIPIE